jgi:hypothetical protein
MANRLKFYQSQSNFPVASVGLQGSYDNSNRPVPKGTTFPSSSSAANASLSSTEKDLLSNIQQSLTSLTKRMKLIENDLMKEEEQFISNSGGPGREGESNAAIPERYLYLLRDLRYKVNELQEIFSSEYQREKEQWLKEKAYYVTQLNEITVIQEEKEKKSQEIINSLKKQYETTLTQTEDSLENNTKVAKKEIERLEGIISYLNELLKKQQIHLELTGGGGAVGQQQQQQQQQPYNPSFSTNPPQQKIESSLLMTKENLEEYYKLQIAYHETLNDLEKAKITNNLLLKRVEDEKQFMENNFHILKATYERMIENLENQVLTTMNNPRSEEKDKEDDPMKAITNNLLPQLRRKGRDRDREEEKRNVNEKEFRNLQNKYDLKCSEMESILK